MILLNRLLTADRLHSWGMTIDLNCKLCLNDLESRDHLFALCEFSMDVWTPVLVLHDIHRSIGDWQSKFNWNLTSLKGKSLKAVIMRLVWRGFLYFIWKERTTVLLHRSLKNPQHVFDKLVVAVKIRLFKLNFPCNQANSKLLENWW